VAIASWGGVAAGTDASFQHAFMTPLATVRRRSSPIRLPGAGSERMGGTALRRCGETRLAVALKSGRSRATEHGSATMSTPSESSPTDDAATATASLASSASRLPRAIWVLGFVSMWMDIASEMIHGLLPAWLVGTVGLSVASVGLLDGVAEGTALFVKMFSGALSDALGRRKGLTVLGYALAAASKPLFALGSIPIVVGARLLDRIGKGLRGAPRDALLTELAPSTMRGAAFGLRQSLDSLGALLGPLVAVGLMSALHGNVEQVFVLAAIPGVASVVLLAVAIKEPARQQPSSTSPTEAGSRAPRWRLADVMQLPPSVWWVVLLTMAFLMARLSESFVILRAHDEGVGLSFVPLVLVGMNAVYAASAWPVGRLADGFSRPTLLAVGLVVLCAGHLVLMVDGLVALVVGVGLWGLHLGLSQGVLAAMLADAAPAHLRGTAFGLFHMVSGLATVASSTLAGLVWERWGPAATFQVGAVAACVTLAALIGVRRSRRAPSPTVVPPADERIPR
jgi:MFS family permease